MPSAAVPKARAATALVACSLLSLGCSAAAAGAPLLVVPYGTPLEELPGAASVQGGADWPSNISLTLVDVPVQVDGPPGRQPMLRATVKLFRNDGTGSIFTNGPTIRVRPGEAFQVSLRNGLLPSKGTQEELEGEESFLKLRLPQTTNLHLHGVWSDPGVQAQPDHSTAEHGVPYSGGDNVFVRIDPGQQQTYTYRVPSAHMPGLYWLHPHFMGSAALGTATAKGAVVIEGNEAALLAPKGCEAVLQLLGSAQERILILESWLFDRDREKPEKYAPDSYPDISEASIPPNPTCCEGNAEAEPFSSQGQAVLTINGGHAPVIRMHCGEWQRWQIVYASYNRYVDLTLAPGQVVAAAANDSISQPSAASCELALLGKDGIWLLKMPRNVPHLMLPPAGRVDLLVRCTGSPGSEAVLSSGSGPLSQPHPMCTMPSCTVIKQPVVATVRLEGSAKPEGTQGVQYESCSPLRSSYVADLSNPALSAANASSKLTQDLILFSPPDPAVPSEDCRVNGQPFRIPDPSPLMAPLGSVVEWTLGFVAFHPHHLHTLPFQIAALPVLAGGKGPGAGRGAGPSGGAGRGVMPGAMAGRRGLRQRGDAGGGQSAADAASLDLEGALKGATEPLSKAQPSASPENLAAWASLTPFFKVGDWHDTLMLPAPSPMGGSAAVRFQPGPWTGYSVHHCHFLMHEDMGCIKIVKWEAPGYQGNKQPAADYSGWKPTVPGTF